MATQDVVEFFHSKRAKAGPGDLNREQPKADWIGNLHHLHELIVDCPRPPTEAKDVVPGYRSTTITEEFMGTDDAPELALVVGDECVGRGSPRRLPDGAW